MTSLTRVGLDVHKESTAVAVLVLKQGCRGGGGGLARGE
jgi:hypothetical protein